MSSPRLIKHITLFTLFVACQMLFCHALFAADLNQEQIQAGIDQNDRNQQFLEQQIQDLIRQKKIQETQRIRDSRNFDDDKKVTEPTPDNGGCVKPQKMEIRGSKLFKAQKLEKKFLKKHLNQCLKKSDIINIQKELNDYYIKKGYSNARVYL
ncbi:MAG: hypothetical protein O3B09_02510, partial [Proteobacteria bacterium]|nr:hypothetical protein [Pseudomonadota bacterium]